jgi:hypothetical protein
MKVHTLLFFSIITLAPTLFIYAQSKRIYSANELGFQYGFSLKGIVEFPLSKGEPAFFRLCSDLGLGSNVLARGLYFSINTELQLYNGGLGNNARKGHRDPKYTFDIISAFSLTTGFNNYLNKDSLPAINSRNIPLYYFSNFTYPALQNPYNYSLTAGTNFIFTLDKHKAPQRVGFLNIHVNRLQLSYYNDGGAPFDRTYLGDGKDRFYSGGALLSFHGKNSGFLNLVELSFSKFTGYTKDAFEVSNKLDLAFVNYNNREQNYYNKSLWSLNVSNPERGFGIYFNRYNYTPWDMQHLIHFSIYNSYHLVPYKDYFSVGGSYLHNYNNIGLR